MSPASLKDPYGRETDYAYDNAGRVTDVWTNLSGQSDEHPLVHYTYDGFCSFGKPPGAQTGQWTVTEGIY